MDHICKDSVICLDYLIKDSEGSVLDSSKEGLMYVLFGHGILPAKLEAELEGKSNGMQVVVELSAEEAYGPIRPELIETTGPEAFEEGLPIHIGMVFERQIDGRTQYARVTSIEDKLITTDANHPFAGKDISWDAVIMGIRRADEEELETGMARQGEKICASKRKKH
jgi:FKBP-type peptidyl-prolyl cis-trans isomerase SlyD